MRTYIYLDSFAFECLGLWGFDVTKNTKYRNAPSLTLVHAEACAQAIILNTNPPYLVLFTVRLPKKALEFSEL